MNKILKRLLLVIIVLAVLAVMLIPLPYYITKPGTTEKLGELVKVEGKADNKNGSFSLTTIGLQHATALTLTIAKFSKYQEIDKESEIRTEGETEAQFNVRQMYYMNSAKNNAIEAAFTKAKKPFKSEYNGIFVLSMTENSDARRFLKEGDTIHAVDGKKFKTSEEFVKYVGTKKIGEKINITYTKANESKERTDKVKMVDIDKKGRAGIGITLVDDKNVQTTPKVTVKTDKIGGPSAGFMFSLEILSDLTREDLTRGYDIAGTGTIEPDGTIGRIGGIEEKIVTAHKAGKDYFLAPDDTITKEMKKAKPGIKTNYADAVKVAKDLGTDMKIIPVKTLDQAVEVLRELPQKNK
ncbi:hypothetical protein BFR40_02555 [Brochothrix thermosphacta]|uniref:SepM family pheromone-processing serine protease n=1 Tax=Brochothrix thermosphacta TaxID=2756 RepID=UPI00083FBD11|nr:SepM family pheromone-processing serine protease [Brochothrix thermosphacta]ODJ53517.1 hypothetical protein BFR40_02555 [Brochothrix thermosphacta]